MEFLFIAAILPVVLLCYYIYKKDMNREPISLLIKLFWFGLLTCIPILICEVFVASWIPVDDSHPFLFIFIEVFLGIALIEELFKWLVTKRFGYHNGEFDEIYDMIVYAVFASLGFACIENILYVFQSGLSVAILRSFLSIPAHTYMGILMGYYFAKARISSINNRNSLYQKNMILSLLIPSLIHTLYDALLFESSTFSWGCFLLLHVTMIVVCISMIQRISKIQGNLNESVQKGTIVSDSDGHVQYQKPVQEIHFCPVCGQKIENYRFCPNCGFKIQF